MQQIVTGIPSGLEDDGAMFRFNVGNVTGGFMHRPIDTPKSDGGTATPPVNWTEYHNLESWVETVKYCARNNKPITLAYDDSIFYIYQSWSETYPTGSGSEGFGFSQVYLLIE